MDSVTQLQLYMRSLCEQLSSTTELIYQQNGKSLVLNGDSMQYDFKPTQLQVIEEKAEMVFLSVRNGEFIDTIIMMLMMMLMMIVLV